MEKNSIPKQLIKDFSIGSEMGGFEKKIEGVCFSDSEALIIAYTEDTIFLIETHNLRVIKKLKNTLNLISELHFWADEDKAVFVPKKAPYGVFFWNTTDNEIIRSFGYNPDSFIKEMSVCTNRRLVLTVNESHNLRVYGFKQAKDIVKEGIVILFSLDLFVTVSDMTACMSSNGDSLVISSFTNKNDIGINKLEVVGLFSDDQERRTIEEYRSEHPFTKLWIDKPFSKILCSMNDGTFCLFKKNRECKTFCIYKSSPKDPLFWTVSPDSNYVFVVYKEQKIAAYCMITHKIISIYQGGIEELNDLVFSKHYAMFITAGDRLTWWLPNNWLDN